MKNKRAQLFWATALVLFAFACKKDKAAADLTTLLVTEPWKYDVRGIDHNKDGKIDTELSLQDCLSDELIYFYPDGSGMVDQGANQCFPGYPQTQEFTWQLLDNNKQLEYAGATYYLIQLNETHLVVYTEEFVGAETVRYIVRYKH